VNKTSAKSVFKEWLGIILVIAGVICLVWGASRGHQPFLFFLAHGALIVVGAVAASYFLGHWSEMNTSPVPMMRILLLFFAWCFWSSLVLPPITLLGSFVPMIMAISFGATACLAEFFWRRRQPGERREIFTPIFWTAVLVGAYLFKLLSGGPWNLTKIISGLVVAGVILSLIPSIVQRIRLDLKRA